MNYDCPCSCEAGFAFDRSQSEQTPGSCCCGRRIVVGPDAEARLRSALSDSDTYEFEIQEIAMPWGEPVQAALAIPRGD